MASSPGKRKVDGSMGVLAENLPELGLLFGAIGVMTLLASLVLFGRGR